MDLRILNTTDRIRESLLANMKEKPFRLITNNDIINKAGISPRTFYRYSKDKNDLLNAINQNISNELTDKLKRISDHLQSTDDLNSIINELMITVLHYIYANKKLVSLLLSQNGEISFWYSLRQAISCSLKTVLNHDSVQHYLNNSQNILIFDTFIDNKLLFIINWLNFTDTVSIQDAEKMLQKDGFIIEKD